MTPRCLALDGRVLVGGDVHAVDDVRLAEPGLERSLPRHDDATPRGALRGQPLGHGALRRLSR